MKEWTCCFFRYIPGFESTIVLDNLENQGYNHLPNNDEVFSFNQVSTILQNVALLHCSGLLLKQKHHANLSISYPFLMNVDMYVQWRVHLFKQGLNYRKGKSIYPEHIGALWTEGPFEKFQFYVLPMKNLFFYQEFC